MKVYGRWKDGQEVKFKLDNSNPNYPFAMDALNNMEPHGMDTLLHMEGDGPSGPAQDLFQYYAQYTKSYMNAFVQECLETVPPTAVKIGPGTVDQHEIECL